MSADLNALAAHFDGQVPPYLVVCGPPAAGKSALAQRLVQAGWVHLDKDRDGDQLSPQIMAALGRDPDDRDSPDYRRYGHGLAMRLLALASAAHLRAGRNVAVEAPFIGAATAAAEAGARLSEVLVDQYGFPEGAATIWVTASHAVRRVRMSARGAARDACKLVDWDSYVATMPEYPEPGVIDVVVKGN